MKQVCLLLMLTLTSQNAALPTFEVATVKPLSSEGVDFKTPMLRYAGCHGTDNSADANTPPQINIPLGRCITKGTPLKSVIAFAYDVPPSQINQIVTGGPQWLDEPYDIEGKAEKPVTAAELKRMLQSLLNERFKLALHREKKEIPVFDLVVVKNGSKLQSVAKDKECVASTTLGPCHSFFGGRGRGLHGQSVSTSDLAMNLTFWADRIVIDKTGLSGLFNIQTTPWIPDNAGPNYRGEAGTDPESLPAFYTMLSEQLGLRLESRKEVFEIFVIDHAEKPALNQH